MKTFFELSGQLGMGIEVLLRVIKFAVACSTWAQPDDKMKGKIKSVDLISPLVMSPFGFQRSPPF